MTAQWEQYVEAAVLALHQQRFGPDLPLGEFGPVMAEMERAEVRAVLESVAPLIAEDTRTRMVEAAAAAVKREDVVDDCAAKVDAARREYAAMDERHLNSCIWIDPGRQSGVACFGGTRVPVDPFMVIAEEAGDEAAQALWPSVTDAHIAAGKLWRKRYHEWLRGAR